MKSFPNSESSPKSTGPSDSGAPLVEAPLNPPVNDSQFSTTHTVTNNNARVTTTR